MTAQLKLIQQRLENAAPLLISKKVSAGLDGFVDAIVKIVNYKTEDGVPAYFQTIAEFGAYITSKSGSGFSLESEELLQRPGGNMPIMANAMAEMGAKVNCVGAFGLPAVVSVFERLHANCQLYSFANPGFTTAVEFTDGKMMLAQMADLNHADWNTLKTKIGLKKLLELFSGCDLVCLVNWSELDHSNKIWQGLLEEIFEILDERVRPKQFFFDLSDCSKRSAATISTALNLIKKFNAYGKVTLSLNQNEATILYKTIFRSPLPVDTQMIGLQLFNEINVDTLVIHSAKISLAWDKYGKYSNVPVFNASPVMLTGAGDNFNAGFCVANLLNLDTELSLIMANMVSNIYITTGKSPDFPALKKHISELFIVNYKAN